MTATSAVAVAGLLQIILRTSFFIEQSKDLCSPAPALSSWIFLVAFLDILSDTEIYPVRYMHLPYICQFVVETLLAILLTEFGAIIVWCSLERLLCRIVKSTLLIAGLPTCYYFEWENYILGGITTLISVLILIYVGQATDHFHIIRRKYVKMEKKLLCNLEELWNCSNPSSTGKRRPLRNAADYAAFICKDSEVFVPQSTRKRRRRRCY